MPGKKKAPVKNPRTYEALKNQGVPKAKAAKIANSQRSDKRKGSKRK